MSTILPRLAVRLSACLFVCTLSATAKPAAAQAGDASKLNIVLMLADDMGYADMNAFGGKFGYTPNMDRLAASGMKMTQFYSAAAVCTPTRAALLTGRYPLANGIDGHFSSRPEVFLRDQTRPDGGAGTLPGILREQGYATLHVGKWHLGGTALDNLEHRQQGSGQYADSPGPHEHGFTDYYLSQEDALSGVRGRLLKTRTLYRDGTKHLVHNDVYRYDPDETRDWTAFKGDAATRFIAKQAKAETPFFLNLWFDTPHTPYEDEHVPEAFHFDTLSKKQDSKLGRTRHVLNTGLPKNQQTNQRRFLGMVTYMDHQVGRVIAALSDPNGDGDTKDSIAENTLVIFTSDNGGAWPADNGPFASGKASVREGGIRVPMIAALPGTIEPGTTSLQIGNTIDFMPSIFSMVGLSDLPDGLTPDGIDLSPVWLKQVAHIERSTMFFDLRNGYRPQRVGPRLKDHGFLAARHGDYKIIFRSKADMTPVALFDLSKDAGEEDNLITKPIYTAKIEAFTHEAQAWLKRMHKASGK